MEYKRVTVRNKVAKGDGTLFVCGNRGYTITFDFDEEWEGKEVKTARFVYGGNKYEEVVFTGSTCPVPVFRSIKSVTVGVYAGDLITTTPARFLCEPSILCGDQTHEEPPTDLYNQLVEAVNLHLSEADNAASRSEEGAEEAERAAEKAEEEADRATNNILNGVETHNASEAAHADIRENLRTVDAIARGKATARVFNTKADLDAWLAVAENVAQLKVGDNLYIRDTGVKDYWWDGAAAQILEAEAPDLTDYYKKGEVDARLPVPIEQSAYDALVESGTVEAGRIYYVVPDGELP